MIVDVVCQMKDEIEKQRHAETARWRLCSILFGRHPAPRSNFSHCIPKVDPVREADSSVYWQRQQHSRKRTATHSCSETLQGGQVHRDIDRSSRGVNDSYRTFIHTGFTPPRMAAAALYLTGSGLWPGPDEDSPKDSLAEPSAAGAERPGVAVQRFDRQKASARHLSATNRLTSRTSCPRIPSLGQQCLSKTTFAAFGRSCSVIGRLRRYSPLPACG